MRPLRDDEPTRWTAGEIRALQEEAEQLRRERDMAREEIAWLREQLPGTPMPEHSDGSDG